MLRFIKKKSNKIVGGLFQPKGASRKVLPPKLIIKHKLSHQLANFCKLRTVVLTVALLLLGGVAFVAMKPTEAVEIEDITVTAAEVQQYLSQNPGASLNDIVDNFPDDIVIEFPAGTYRLSDNLIMERRLVLRGAEGTTPEDVIMDGGSYFDEAEDFQPGYSLMIMHAGAMVEGVTLTHFSPAYYGGGSIDVNGGTVNRCIIMNNITDVPLFPVIKLTDGTLSGNLIAHNGTGDSYLTERPSGIIITSHGASHIVGNTIVNNQSPNYFYSDRVTVPIELRGDSILENNVFFNNSIGTSQTLTDASNGRQYKDTSTISIVNRNFMTYSSKEESAIKYMNNWIHKDTENNVFTPIYLDTDEIEQLNTYASYFTNFPLDAIGAWDYPGSPGKPDFDYSPSEGSPLIDAGTDVFYPVIQKDLAGRSHFLGNAPDIGAYESPGATPTFTTFPGDIVYVTEHGSGAKDGTSWENAMDGNAKGGVQNALIAAVRGKAHQIWVAQGEYVVPGRELLYTRTISHWYKANDGMVGGVWSGLLLAPIVGDDPNDRMDMKLYGGFVGNETSIDQRPNFTYQNSEGTDTGLSLIGSSQGQTTHFIGERGYTLEGQYIIHNGFEPDYNLPFVPIQPDYMNLVNQDNPTDRQPTLPSQGVHVISQVEAGHQDVEPQKYQPLVDGVEVSNGFSAVYPTTLVDNMQHGVKSGFQGGAGVFMYSGLLKNAWVHDNYDAVANFQADFLTCGGGIFMNGGKLENVVVTDNVSETTGGGILLSGASLYGGYIANNYAFNDGGGIHTGTEYNDSESSPEIVNAVIVNNHSLGIPTSMEPSPGGNGGGLWLSDANKTSLKNSTVFGNSAASEREPFTFKLTIPEDSYLYGYGYKSDLDGEWVLDDSYHPTIKIDYEWGEVIAQPIRYTRKESSIFYYYIFTWYVDGVLQPIYDHLFSEDDILPENFNGFSVAGINSSSKNTPTTYNYWWVVQYLSDAYYITIADDGTLADYKSDLDGEWVVDASYHYACSVYTRSDITRYIRNKPSPYYYYVIDDNPKYSGATGRSLQAFSKYDNIEVSCSDNNSLQLNTDTLLNNYYAERTFYYYMYSYRKDFTILPIATITGEWSVYQVPPRLGIVNGSGDNIYISGGALTNVASLGARRADDIDSTDIYVTDDALLDQITYSAATTIKNSSGAVALGSTNITTGLDDFERTFLDPFNGSFRITDQSPLFSNALALSDVKTDITGATRFSADIGAYTYAVNMDDNDDKLGVPNTGHKVSSTSPTSFNALPVYVLILIFAGASSVLALAIKRLSK
ncbi:MAG: hypothetical protein LBQ02_02810 [Candidatus Nomurabacteria bacterium]|nr:hypothetical protein [Candidatus Nomurabacteria bacterium]